MDILLTKINSEQPLFMTEYYHLGGWEGLAARAPRLEAQLSSEVKRPENQAYAALSLAAMIADGRLDEAGRYLDQAVMVRHSNDLLIADLSFTLKQLGRSPAERERFKLEDKFCDKPFTMLEITPDFEMALLCCGLWLKRRGGNPLEAGSPLDLWLSPSAEILRKSVLDGTFAFCHKTLCPRIAEGALTRRDQVDIPRVVRDSYQGPKDLRLAFDATCNLWCVICRNQKEAASAEKQRQYIDLVDKIVLPLAASARTLQLDNAGEIFASPSMLYARDRISRLPHLEEVNIFTNAQLFDPELFEKMPALAGRVGVSVSVDAARPETYRLVRRGGDFDRLLTKLKLIADFRRRGLVKSFGMHFVVQKQNFREMAEFVDLARALGADRTFFFPMGDRGNLTLEEYADQCVWKPYHPDYEEWAEIAGNPVFRTKGVDLHLPAPGSLQ